MENSIIKQLGLWFAGQALPNEAVLHYRVTQARRGLIFALMGGIMLSAAIIALHVVAYFFMIQQGIDTLAAITLIILSAALVGGVFLHKASKLFDTLSHIKHDLQVSSPLVNSAYISNDIMSEFMRGFNSVK